MNHLPRLRLADIQARASDKVFERGKRYEEERRIQQPAYDGYQLEAFCEGSVGYPYWVQVTLDTNGIVSTSCTCPYDYGGDCKHVVALLLTYMLTPQYFMEKISLQQQLQQKSAAELRKLIMTMLDYRPELIGVVRGADDDDLWYLHQDW